ncbi:hypothetical protein, partial [Streptomyces sp. NPDC056405]|uniref:hypothetical protein n=1 Tax=Streptomyces sp. NPDC056405 TaxID=3345811 RepID=UPI0035DE53A1
WGTKMESADAAMGPASFLSEFYTSFWWIPAAGPEWGRGAKGGGGGGRHGAGGSGGGGGTFGGGRGGATAATSSPHDESCRIS